MSGATIEGPEMTNAAFQPLLRARNCRNKIRRPGIGLQNPCDQGIAGRFGLKKESSAALREHRLVVNVSLTLLHDGPILKLLPVEHLELPVEPGLLPGLRPERLSSHLFSQAGRPRRFLTR